MVLDRFYFFGTSGYFLLLHHQAFSIGKSCQNKFDFRRYVYILAFLNHK